MSDLTMDKVKQMFNLEKTPGINQDRLKTYNSIEDVRFEGIYWIAQGDVLVPVPGKHLKLLEKDKNNDFFPFKAHYQEPLNAENIILDEKVTRDKYKHPFEKFRGNNERR